MPDSFGKLKYIIVNIPGTIIHIRPNTENDDEDQGEFLFTKEESIGSKIIWLLKKEMRV